ncbi:MAG: 30S ribosomal protein S2 [Candidatus Marinimicrobia bacterium]|nr:30S ribosomal protein S2 [Candidatus Neomarinimicrobiota bacterium]
MSDSNTSINTKLEDKNQDNLLEELEVMYRAGVHFGYSRSSRHPKMEPYLCGLKNGVEIFDLEKTVSCFKKAEDFISELGANGKKVLIVSTKPEIKDVVEKAGRELGMPYVLERWLGGTLTNFESIKKRVGYFKKLCDDKMNGAFSELSKKDASRADKQITKLERRLGGFSSLSEIPAALVVVDPKRSEAAVMEAKKMGVPVVGFLNSDCNPEDVDYPVPGNDASFSSVQYFLDRVVKAYKAGQQKTETTTKKEEEKPSEEKE